MKLGDLGERKIISVLSNITGLPYKDDCSFIDNGDSYFLLTTDVIGQKTHMPKGSDPYLIGQFFASINLSDIAAMAGKPLAFMTAYSISPDTEMDFLEDLEQGMMKTLKRYNTDFIGGDLKEGDDITLTGIAIGTQTKKLTRKRSDIAEKQMVGYTNDLGRAASGYIFYNEILFSIDEKDYKDFSSAMESEHINVNFIGETWKGDNIIFDGESWSEIEDRGYEHFRPSPHMGKIS